jgi:hypothetical protein
MFEVRFAPELRHKTGGLRHNDFVMAAKKEDLFGW